MHLLNARTRKLEYFIGSPEPTYHALSRTGSIGSLPDYAILSHTWRKEEVSMQDVNNDPKVDSKEGYRKILFTCEQALADGIDYAWVDTCCIDKTSSAELSEAINSMFRWYKQAVVCYAYLSDISISPDTANMAQGADLFPEILPGFHAVIERNRVEKNFDPPDNHTLQAPFAEPMVLQRMDIAGAHCAEISFVFRSQLELYRCSRG
ncbi:hypothetical protein LTR37_010441 [Vermiconidia calcicola]|uniref:Uncharacterized protein n=1 Tax=Vermiconidia calcicola TaxID=1690605 RepID=A0ACC3N6M9_9PEZI|nr:hypothetical protein LTR37_010441 [Vermiconidia calcicola]